MYYFDVSYPASANESVLKNIEQNVLYQFPHCTFCTNQLLRPTSNQYRNTIYTTNNPQDITRLAVTLKNIDPSFFIGYVSKDNNIFYYHPTELAFLSPKQKASYYNDLKHLPLIERTVHDYLVNIYHEI